MNKLVWMSSREATGWHGFEYEAVTPDGRMMFRVYSIDGSPHRRRHWNWLVKRDDILIMAPHEVVCEKPFPSARAAKAAAEYWLKQQKAQKGLHPE